MSMTEQVGQHELALTIPELFTSVGKIQDTDLRDCVIAIWAEAIQTGNGGRGWSIDNLQRLPFTLLAGEIEMCFIEHINSCAQQCLAIAGVLVHTFGERVPIHMDHLIAGALLADVGKLFEIELDSEGNPTKGAQGRMLRHPFTGVAIASRHGIPDAVLHIIATHSHEGDRVQRSIESIIFHHADFIDFDIAKLRGGVG
jgi:putative nucleotidyltransferase with HDIG domain